MSISHALSRTVLAVCAIILFTAPAAQATVTDVHEYTLDNGMRLLVKPDARAPVVVSQLWFPVGSSYEQPGTTGVSHALEHMMFKGTENRESGEFSRIIAREGGRQNAFTGRDFTSYFEQLRADRLEIALELEADRLANIRFDADEFAREMEVINEERRLTVDDNPFSVARERFNALAWATSPYRQPIIGWQEDLDQFTVDDLRDWYAHHYGVNNAILVIVGNVQPDAVHDLVKKHFGGLEPRPVPKTRARAEIPGLGERRAVLRVKNATPYLMMGYHAPSLGTAENQRESYALSLLSSILDGGESARLPERLVRGSEVASSVGAGYSGITRLDTHFSLVGRPGPDGSLDELEQAVRAEVRRVIEDGITEEELERAKIQARADYVYQLDSLFYQAMEIGMLETAGIGWETMNAFETAIAQVTVEDVHAVAQRYLTDDRLTVVHLLPRDDDSVASAPTAGTPTTHGSGH
ncbi:MAG: pitrilysin family protein [Aquisalimonadaceae bacterium]